MTTAPFALAYILVSFILANVIHHAAVWSHSLANSALQNVQLALAVGLVP